MNDDLSVAILGWKSLRTTRHSLETYKAAGLFDCCGEFFIYYNQYSEEDRRLGEEMGVRTLGDGENRGNWGGQKKILENAKNDYILFLENDHPVVTSPEETRYWMTASLELLKSGRADMVQLRHRQRLGDGYGYNKFFQYHYIRELEDRLENAEKLLPPNYGHDTPMRFLRRHLRPFAAIRRHISIAYLEKHPERIMPKWIKREGDFLIFDSRILNFSESPFMVSRSFYEKISAFAEKHTRHRTILGHQELEYILNCRWWRQQHFRIAMCDRGIFGHQRLDDSWRPNHSAFNAAISEGRA